MRIWVMRRQKFVPPPGSIRHSSPSRIMPPGPALPLSISSPTVATELGLATSKLGEQARMVMGLNLVGS